jgi:hypothetical protein
VAGACAGGGQAGGVGLGLAGAGFGNAPLGLPGAVLGLAVAGPDPVAKPVAWWPAGAAGDNEAIRMSYPQTSQNRPVAGAWHCGHSVSAEVADGVAAVEAAADVELDGAAGVEAPAIGVPHTSQ